MTTNKGFHTKSASVNKALTTTTTLKWDIQQVISGQNDTHTYNWFAIGY